MTVTPAAKAAHQDDDISSDPFLGIHHGPPRSRAAILRAVTAAAVLAFMGLLTFTACSDDDDDDASTDTNSSANTVKATEADGTIKLDKTSSDTGNIDFEIQNTGKLTHEFVVLKTDRSTVDESADGVDEVGEREGIAPGTQAELSFDDLASGNYVLICNVPGHYGLGMHTAFTVS